MNTEQFISKFATEDVRSLAFKASKYPDVNMPYALNQISGRQTALKKLPAWAATDGVIYPPHLSMEQCSSEFTALYKQQIVQRVVGKDYTMTDLTGGFGVDFMYMSELSSKAVYVERNAALCETVKHNVTVFGRTNVEIVNAEAEEFLETMRLTDVIYVDPARRDSSGGRTYAISDCTPDILKLLPQLLSKANYVLVKLSPMLDHIKTAKDLNKVCRCVKEVHIVSVAGECKEMLVLLSLNADEDYTIYCVNDADKFVFKSDYKSSISTISEEDLTDMNLYEPNASIMKAGCFGAISEHYNVSALACNSNLFVSRRIVDDFPGRKFHILRTTTMNKKELSFVLSGIKKANITVRNFPMTVSDLRKRLKIGDGGNMYIFATTKSSGTHILLLCEKISNNQL